jgi:hypothetical protein
MSKAKPNATSCSNTGHYLKPRYTSPCCYVDLSDDDIDQDTGECPDCGRALRLSVDMVPSYTAELIEDEQ